MDLPLELEDRVAKELEEAKPPVLPEVARAVLEATKSERTEPRSVADILKRDAAMAAGILRTANSPAYAARAAIVSVPQAISRLGFETIRRISMLVACDERVFLVRGREDETRRLYWHSTLTAFVAQEIARTLKQNVEEAFMGGLLHDIGKSVVMQAMASLEKRGRPFSEEEMRAVAMSLHEELGARSLATWGLPVRSVAAVAHHHRPLAAPPLGRDVACIVSVANDVAHGFETGEPLDVDTLSPRLAAINLYFEDLSTIVDRKDELISWTKGL